VLKKLSTAKVDFYHSIYSRCFNHRILQLLGLWIPVLIQMGLIFYFSAQPAGSPTLERFPLPPDLGHLGGYGLLSLLLYRAFNRSLFGWSIRPARNTLLVNLLYALSDELHQMFVPGRTPAVSDLVIDAAGVILALLFIRLVVNPLHSRLQEKAG